MNHHEGLPGRHLGVKLLLSYLASRADRRSRPGLASETALPGSFNRHMLGMGGRPMMGMGGGQGPGGRAAWAQLYLDFRASFNEALTFAVLASIIVASCVSLFFSRSVVAPLRAMTAASQRIADGHYDERVGVHGEDELAQLAARFNQMAEKLEQVESMRRRLIGDVSHELRTPLTAIKGSMEGLIDGILPADAGTYEQIHAEAERLNRLVDDLAGAQPRRGRFLSIGHSSIGYWRIGSTRLPNGWAPSSKSRRISLDLDLAPDLPRALADEDRTTQVLTNLAGNALQYTPEGGRVSIAARRTDGEIQDRGA